jgi:hypothetical protein
MNFGADTIPMLRPDVIARDDPNGKLLFQISTDEMYLVDTPSFALLSLCDGQRTLMQIAGLVADAKGANTEDVVAAVTPFFTELVHHGLIEIWG